jgi:hypothetical protein
MSRAHPNLQRRYPSHQTKTQEIPRNANNAGPNIIQVSILCDAKPPFFMHVCNLFRFLSPHANSPPISFPISASQYPSPFTATHLAQPSLNLHFSPPALSSHTLLNLALSNCLAFIPPNTHAPTNSIATNVKHKIRLLRALIAEYRGGNDEERDLRCFVSSANESRRWGWRQGVLSLMSKDSSEAGDDGEEEVESLSVSASA